MYKLQKKKKNQSILHHTIMNNSVINVIFRGTNAPRVKCCTDFSFSFSFTKKKKYIYTI